MRSHINYIIQIECVNGCTVLNKSMAFKKDEYHQLAEAFRDIAKRLQAYADEIDAAKRE